MPGEVCARFPRLSPRLSLERRKAGNAVWPPCDLGDRCQQLGPAAVREVAESHPPSHLCPLPRAPPKTAACPLSRRTGTSRGACTREAELRPTRRPEEESCSAGLPLRHGHVPADLRPAANWEGEREQGRRRGQWLSSASCQSRGPGKDAQTPSTALVLGWGVHAPEGHISLGQGEEEAP